MRNVEFTNTVLELLRQHKTNKEIALITHKHRNTISKRVQYIRQNLIRTPEEVVNKIDSKLDNELENMAHRDLIQYRRILMPQRIEAHTVAEINVDEKHVTIVADYNRAIEAAVNRDIQALRARQQVDTTPANSQAS